MNFPMSIRCRFNINGLSEIIYLNRNFTQLQYFEIIFFFFFRSLLDLKKLQEVMSMMEFMLEICICVIIYYYTKVEFYKSISLIKLPIFYKVRYQTRHLAFFHIYRMIWIFWINHNRWTILPNKWKVTFMTNPQNQICLFNDKIFKLYTFLRYTLPPKILRNSVYKIFGHFKRKQIYH